MSKKAINHFLRTLGLSGTVDRVRYLVEFLRKRRRNRQFVEAHPDVILPPPYLVYESYAMDFRNYWEDGRDTARYMLSVLERFKEIRGATLLDWGCGPARVVRHMPALLQERGCAILGTDYNPDTIAWCKANIPGVAFSNNGAEPPLAYPASSIDAMYAISVLTHLTPEQHQAWIAEIARVLKPGGVALLTTHGRAYRFNLMPWEQARFDKGELVARGNAKIGHRTYTSFHPPAFMADLFKKGALDVLCHLEGGPGSVEFSQDVWVVRRP